MLARRRSEALEMWLRELAHDVGAGQSAEALALTALKRYMENCEDVLEATAAMEDDGFTSSSEERRREFGLNKRVEEKRPQTAA